MSEENQTQTRIVDTSGMAKKSLYGLHEFAPARVPSGTTPTASTQGMTTTPNTAAGCGGSTQGTAKSE